MFHITLITVGKLKERYYAAAADEYYQIAKTFAETGVKVLDFETFADLDGILPAIKKLRAEYDMFIAVSFSVNQFGYSAAGLSAKRLLADAAAVPEIDAVGLNCGVGPAHMRQILEKAGRPGDKFLLAIPNAGYPTLTRNKLQFGNTPVYFAEKMKELQELGADILGGCCGTDPEFIREMSARDGILKKSAPEKEAESSGQSEPVVRQGFLYDENGNRKEKKLIAVELAPPFDADGWRLDVAADLGKTEEFNHAFWRMFRTAVKSVSPDKLILAEHYGDAAPWLTGNQWDSIMNYDAFMEPVTWFLTGVSKHSTEKREDMYNNADVFWGTMSYQMGKLPSQAISVAMNQLSNHDHSRFLTRTNRQIGRVETEGSAAADANVEKAVLREAVLLQMTWNGAPTVYYGDEAGVTGWTDPDNRRTYPWGREDMELIAFHKAAISLRKEYPVLRHGSLKQLYGAYGVLAYGRFDETEKILVALNNTEEIRTESDKKS
mgnify:CR=1 FL=1